ncbi:MAG: hypothetical protein MMC33_007289 [Icmadophila ericetorum]|nr:hypothetical protein [Icmadophila ericetorum]
MAQTNFFAGPGPEITVQRIDFTKTPLPELNGLYAVVLDNVLSASECAEFVTAAEATSNGVWEQAQVNIGGNQQALITDIRDCGRIIWDDKEIAAKIWNRVKRSVPEIEFLKDVPYVTGWGPAKRKEIWKAVGLNERMRFLKYGAGQYFRPHCDGMYERPDRSERSYYTLHLYLNESDPNGPYGEMKGGATSFHSDHDINIVYNVEPKIGRVLIFQHRGLLHSGEEVDEGTKLTLRTDIMYSRTGEEFEKPVLRRGCT